MNTRLETLHQAPWKHLASVDSTNAYIMRRNKRELPEGFTCSAVTQTMGQGRHHRDWFSPAGGVYLSIFLRPTVSTKHWNLFPFVAALAAAEAIEKSAPGLHIALKWPNDLLLDMKKTGGILVQSTMGPSPGLVCGVGINIDCSPGDFPPRLLFPATSLKAHTPDPPTAESLARTLRNHLFNHYIYWERTPEYFLEDWESRSLLTGRTVTIRQSHQTISGKCLGIRRDGFLLIEHSGGTEALCNGDVIDIGRVCS